MVGNEERQTIDWEIYHLENEMHTRSPNAGDFVLGILTPIIHDDEPVVPYPSSEKEGARNKTVKNKETEHPEEIIHYEVDGFLLKCPKNNATSP